MNFIPVFFIIIVSIRVVTAVVKTVFLLATINMLKEAILHSSSYACEGQAQKYVYRPRLHIFFYIHIYYLDHTQVSVMSLLQLFLQLKKN